MNDLYPRLVAFSFTPVLPYHEMFITDAITLGEVTSAPECKMELMLNLDTLGTGRSPYPAVGAQQPAVRLLEGQQGCNP